MNLDPVALTMTLDAQKLGIGNVWGSEGSFFSELLEKGWTTLHCNDNNKNM